MTDSEHVADLRHLQFSPVLEYAFQLDYYIKTVPGLRVGFLLIAALHVVVAAVDFCYFGTLNISTWIIPVTGLALIGLTFYPRLQAIWQPVIVGIFIVISYIVLTHITSGSLYSRPYFAVNPIASDAHSELNFLMVKELWLIILGFVLTRLQFRWFVVGTVTVFILTIAIAAITTKLPGPDIASSAVVSVFIPVTVLMFVAYAHERGARSEFLANHLLDEERADEERKRKLTERMLHILGQAMGGIVHDLGNPLTAVQTGACTLMHCVRQGDLELEVAQEIAQIITNGAEMLNYLRLSLIEQTRVLEGKAIPLECKFVNIRHVAEVGIQFQKPPLTHGRTITLVGEDQEVYIDEMKMITVCMNLVGNALKYSDGEIRITWHIEGQHILIAVLDQGKAAIGITREQADSLFKAFGRLDTHSQIEGTGLGLLSARKIVEAHEGEIFLTGYTDGTPASAPFTTAQGQYSALLTSSFRTAFVIACPHLAVRLLAARA